MTDAPDGFRYFDAHTHFQPPRLFAAIRRWFDEHTHWNLRGPTAPADVAAALRAAGVERFVFFSYAHRPGIARNLNRWLRDTAGELPDGIPLGTVHAADEDPGAAMDEACGTFGFAGLKFHIQVQGFHPDDRRRLIHREIATALERVYADRLEAVQDQLAYNWGLADEAGKAVDALVQCAEIARQLYAPTDAVALLDQAPACVEELPVAVRDRRRLEIFTRKAYALSLLGRFREVRELIVQHRERIDALDDPTLAGPFYFRLGLTHAYLAEHAGASEAAQRALREAERCDGHRGARALRAGLETNTGRAIPGSGSSTPARLSRCCRRPAPAIAWDS